MPSVVINWNLYPSVTADVHVVPHRRAAVEQTASLPRLINRGAGRSYGDASLGEVILQHGADRRLLAFDAERGILEAEAGLLLDEVLQVMVPRGWFLRVTPGTRFVTLGGAVASDVHGKNHHVEGSFYDAVEALTLALPTGEVVRCSRTQRPDLFQATFGGMGLTGTILTVRLRLRPITTAYIQQHTYKARNLDHIFRLFETHAAATYSVAWIDCVGGGTHLGRSVLLLGEHAAETDLPPAYRRRPLPVHRPPRLSMPFFLPRGVLNQQTIRLFNAFYYRRYRDDHRTLVHYGPYFYPLDGIHHWNRMYGRRGFVQYQFVIPPAQGYEGVKAVLEAMVAFGQASFLAVLKQFGDANPAPLSFPTAGYTLAVDFPIQEKLWPFLRRLDDIVMKYGGRLYLAKDARMPADVFQAGYPQWKTFRSFIRKLDPQRKMQSLMAQRLTLT